jgi:phosphate starvation-inducible PhoH-like protein
MSKSLTASECRLPLQTPSLAPLVAGPAHRNLTLVEDAFNVIVTAQGGDIVIKGTDSISLNQARDAVLAMIARAQGGDELGLPDVRASIAFVRAGSGSGQGQTASLSLPGRRAGIKPRTPMQAQYLQALASGTYDLVFGVGPAGTGKTFLAVAVGVSMLLDGRVSRVVVTRPAVEAGERLGFLPGDLEEKIDPYLQPIWDAFKALLGAAQLERRKANGEIEVAPLAFMRGRTLSDAFVIVDEAQNTTKMQMKMLLTRLGEGSRMVVNGDPSQTDLPRASDSGLGHALHILRRVEGARQIYFSREDVVRHPLVGRIVAAYEEEDPKGKSDMAKEGDKHDLEKSANGPFQVEVEIDHAGWEDVFGPDPQAYMEKIVAAAAAFSEPAGENFTLLLTDDAQIRTLNARWRQKDQPTNVLSFPAPKLPNSPYPTLGDVALAYETCVREADEQKKTLKDHATHLVLHGLLHLLGYDHEADDEAVEMEGLEREILANLGIADPYHDDD